MSDAWFAHKLAPDGDTTDGCHPDEAQALKDYLSGQSTPSQAAEAITSPISQHSSNPNADLSRLWSLLTDALIDLPLSTVSSLVALLRAIEALPPPSGWSALPETSRSAHGQLWRGLPGFGHFWADEYPSLRQWLDGGSGDGSIPEAESEAFVARCVRRAVVEARLAREGLAGIPMDWGYDCVADALERSHTTGVELEAQVRMACKWIEVAGNKFREGAEKGESSWGLERERNLWKGEARGRMSNQRWIFWIRRLKELQEDETISEIMRDAVRECVSSISEGNASEKSE